MSGPAQIAMYLLREELKSSYPFYRQKIWRKRPHTAIHAYEKILKEIEKNKKLEEEINLIKQRVFSS